MLRTSDKDIKIRKILRIVKNILLGKTIFNLFFRVYIFVILVGAIFLYTPLTHSSWDIPNQTTEGTHPYTFWNALFIACSAFTDTGLTCVNVSTFFNFFGEFIVFLLLWFGGIGIISLFYVIWNFFRKSDSIKLQQIILLQSERGTTKLNNTFKSIRFSVLFIITVQIFFGFIYSFWLCWMPIHVQGVRDLGNNMNITYDLPEFIDAHNNYGISIWQGMFCSFSAMNNAGFDVFQQNISIAAFRNDWNVIFQLFTMFEIIIGGIGYPLIFDIYEKIRLKKKNINYKLTLFSKVCLSSYFIILGICLIFAYSFEFGATNVGHITLAGINNTSTEKFWGDNETFNKCWSILYNTISTRSAGFSTINQNLFTTGTHSVYIVMMFIGASPSSTAGGIRTTTLVVIFATIISIMRGRTNVSILKRNIPKNTVINSFVVFFVALLLIFLSVIIILYTPTIENSDIKIGSLPQFDFLNCLYEVSSAFGTVGLTIGITTLASPIALFVLVICMFVGQLGVSNSLLSWTKKISLGKNINYAQEDIRIG